MTPFFSITRSALLLSAFAVLTLSSCDRDEAEQPTPTNPGSTNGSVAIQIEHLFDTLPFELGSTNYVTANGDTLSFSIYKYYISNIRLIRPDGSSYSESESYHLVNAADSNSARFTLANVPTGNYSGIEFMLGVDSTRNVSGAQTGALDPINGMFWTWNSGYIMAKMEGNSPQSSALSGEVTFHVGGFTGPNNSIRVVSPSFNGDQANVTASATPEIHLACDVAEWFRTPNTVNLYLTNYQIGPNFATAMLATNYADQFSVEHIHN